MFSKCIKLTEGHAGHRAFETETKQTLENAMKEACSQPNTSYRRNVYYRGHLIFIYLL